MIDSALSEEQIDNDFYKASYEEDRSCQHDKTEEIVDNPLPWEHVIGGPLSFFMHNIEDTHYKKSTTKRC